MNDGDKSNSTALLALDGSTSNPLRKGHNIQSGGLNPYTSNPSAIMDPYFSINVHLTTIYDATELTKRLDHFRTQQGAGLAMIDPLQTPDKVAIGFFARSPLL